jgi:CarD family transcriptional regulator
MTETAGKGFASDGIGSGACTQPATNHFSWRAREMSSERVMFGVGEKAVYPCHGVGTIENIESCEIAGTKQDFYVLKIHATGAKVMVPTRAAQTVGLRAVISPREVEKIYDILKSPSKKSTATWNRRFRALNEKLNTGNLVEIAEVLRDLSSLRHDKDLSFGEKKMLERARAMIVSEISAAKNLDRCSVETELNHILLPL